jgi:hypothetical protein
MELFRTEARPTRGRQDFPANLSRHYSGCECLLACQLLGSLCIIRTMGHIEITAAVAHVAEEILTWIRCRQDL